MSKQNKRTSWKNRIIGYGEKKASEFKFNPLNWKTHPTIQREALNSILTKIGWVTGVIENSVTGNLVDGHARVAEALNNTPDEIIPFTTVELTEAEEKEILILLDPIGLLAETDLSLFKELSDLVNIQESALLEVLAEIKIPQGIETIALVREENNGIGEMLNYLKFGGKQIPLTEDELAALFKIYNTYCEENGTHYGFVSKLLGL